jgi:hypothetical protein
MEAFSSAYPGVADVVGGWSFGLANSGEAVQLFNDAWSFADSVAFDDDPPWPLEADGMGSTLELIEGTIDNALVSEWLPSTVHGGTPGAPNSVGTAVEPFDGLIPLAFSLDVFPNPFVDSVRLPVSLARSGEAHLEVFDVLGRRVDRVSLGQLAPGRHAFTWQPDSISAVGPVLFRLLVDGVPVARATAILVH